MTVTTTSNSMLQSRTLALLLRGWLEKHNKPAVKFAYLLELVRSLRYLVQRSNIMTSPDDLTAMVFINAERFIASTDSIDHSLHSILFTSFGISAKCCEDDRLFNTHIAQACGMRLDHLNKMEVLFLTQLKFEVTLSPEQANKFFEDAKKRWEGRPSVTVHHAPFYSVSRLVSSFLHSSNSHPKPTTTRTLSLPALFQSSSSSSSSSIPVSTPSVSLPAPYISVTTTKTTQRTMATRTVSTPNFGTASSLSKNSSSSSSSSSSIVAKSSLVSKIDRSRELTKRPEKTTSRLLNFFRSRDE